MPVLEPVTCCRPTKAPPREKTQMTTLLYLVQCAAPLPEACYLFSGSSKVHLLPSQEAFRADFTLSTALAHKAGFFRAALSDRAGSEVDCSGCSGAAPRKGLPPMSLCAPVSSTLPVPQRPSNPLISPACTWLPSIPIVTVPPVI